MGEDATLRTVFPCPLCHERGRAVLLEAQLERDAELRLVVTGLRGCRHAAGFGDPVVLTFEEEWRLIEAALEVVDRCPASRLPSRPTGSSRTPDAPTI